MAYINPLLGPLQASVLVHRIASSEKDAQGRRVVQPDRNFPQTRDTFEHAVESADALNEIHEEAKQKDPRKRKRRQPKKPSAALASGRKPIIDVKA